MSSEDKKRPQVGVGVLIKKDGKVLLGKRRNAHGEGQWAPPGGHLEFGESWEECGAREVLEETSLQIDQVNLLHVTNDIFEKENKHYITLILSAEHQGGEVTICEPEKVEKWQWFDPDSLPSPLFPPMEKYFNGK